MIPRTMSATKIPIARYPQKKGWPFRALCWAMLFLITSSLSKTLLCEESSWHRAELHRKFIRDEGLLDPEDWVFIYFIPTGASYRIVAADSGNAESAKALGGSPLNRDEGQTFKGKTMIQFQIGGRDRLKVFMEGRSLDFRNLEDHFWVEWSRSSTDKTVSLKR
jgi:hypothetical protein